MDKIAKEFQNNHKKGTVSNVTSYSFKFEKVKDKTKPIIFDIWDEDPVYIEVFEYNKTVQIEQIEHW